MDRRIVGKIFVILFAGLLLSSCQSSLQPIPFLVGSYAPADSTGVYYCELVPKSGSITIKSSLSGIKNPSFLVLHPEGETAYSVAESADQQGNGEVWSINISDGRLELGHPVSSGGANPCHLSINDEGSLLFVANYSGGNVGLINIRQDDQSLESLKSVYQHVGEGPNKARQSAPHAHSISFFEPMNMAIACDLGTDQVLVYQINNEGDGMQVDSASGYTCAPGAGPRHLDFSPDNRHVYVLNELNSTLDALSVSETGQLHAIETYHTLPDDYAGMNYCADVHVHPTGKYVYASNRGHNSIVVYQRDAKTSRLDRIERQNAPQRRHPLTFNRQRSRTAAYSAANSQRSRH